MMGWTIKLELHHVIYMQIFFWNLDPINVERLPSNWYLHKSMTILWLRDHLVSRIVATENPYFVAQVHRFGGGGELGSPAQKRVGEPGKTGTWLVYLAPTCWSSLPTVWGPQSTEWIISDQMEALSPFSLLLPHIFTKALISCLFSVTYLYKSTSQCGKFLPKWNSIVGRFFGDVFRKYCGDILVERFCEDFLW